MQCPVCHIDQVIVEFHGVELDVCIDGCGTWFDDDELRQLFEAAGAPALVADLEQRLQELPPGRDGPTRRCPRCAGRMQHVQTPGASGQVIFDRCRRGHGLWFDRGELEEILSLEVSTDGEGARALATVRAFLGQFAGDGSPRDG
ncbi:MAG: zf-TFIIB domain-containing protein [Planctomycetota bacterium]|nr:zf-TFIIB domain-containing protein [Planctomycetota bacterium]